MKFNVWLAAVSLATLVGFSSCEENKADEPKVLGSEIKLNNSAWPQALSLGNSNPVFSDGMTWAGDNTIYCCQNDAQQAGSTGIVYKIALSDPTTGSLSEFKTGLKDPSGVTKITFDNNKYLLVNESQFGHVLGVETGNPNFPFRVLVYPLN